MKRNHLPFFLFLFLFAWLAGAAFAADKASPIRLSEPVESDADAEVFGAVLDESLPLRRLTDLIAEPDGGLGVPVRVQVRVAEVCQKKGCFFIATDGDATVRVSFRDYAFFVPTDIGGRTVMLAGELVRTTRSKEQAEHLSSDAGAAIPAGPAYELVATSVRVPRH